MDWVSVSIRAFVGFVLLYILFLCVWFQRNVAALRFARKNREKKWKVPAEDADTLVKRSPIKERRSKTLYFVRHGESLWNLVFNRSKLPFVMIPRLIWSAVVEIGLIIAGKEDSWFLDSPLSGKGVTQATELRDFLSSSDEENKDAKVLNGIADEASSIVCSNLRRCMSTGLIGFSHRLKRTEEQVVVLPCLQEITFNPDGLSLSHPFEQPEPSLFDLQIKHVDMKRLYARNIDPSENTGNKDPTKTGLDRLNAFNEWLFNVADKDTVIVNGHSLWFMSYFRVFLPRHAVHVSKRKKLKNCAVVRLTVSQLTLENGEVCYKIDPDDIREVHFGFKK